MIKLTNEEGNYFFSAANGGFYSSSLRANYENAGTWPDDALPISDRWYRYLINGQARGRVITANEYCQPVLANPPEPTLAELISQAEATRAALMDKASAAIAPLQDAEELGIAADDEAELLIRWKRYRVMLNRLDLSAAPAIEWPELPA
ncbi:tail fiber assembly protein [Enterobacter cloacae]|uniref:tail fiber assembly protein n=1 Tax=Enterobacter cloacae TaxID=550 RepID=UPI0032AEFB8D